MQIGMGLHSQLAEVDDKKHHYFKARMIMSRDASRPALCQLGLVAGGK